MAPKPVLTKDRTLIKASTFAGVDWLSCTDIAGEREMETFKRAADQPMETHGSADLTYADATLEAYWDEATHAAIVRQWKANPSFFDDGTLSLTGLGLDKVPMGAADTYAYSVKSVGRAGSDASTRNEKARLTVVLSVWSL